MQNRRKELYDSHTALQVLSGLMHKPLLLQDAQYALIRADFSCKLHEIIFSVIYNLAQNGYESIRPIDVDSALRESDSQYEYYKQASGPLVVEDCYQAFADSDPHQFDYAYSRLKKFSVLRDLEECGIDTTRFYNPDAMGLNKDIEEEKLRKTPISGILNAVQENLVTIENTHIGKDQGKAQNVGKGLDQLLESLAEHPEIGLPLQGDIVNYACRGARLGKLYVYSAPSGQGKSRYMVGNACALSMPYLNENKEIVIRGTSDHYDYQKILFVTTEQQADEIQTMVLAYVSGVNEQHILQHELTTDEEERIMLAKDIIKTFQENFRIECMSDPSITMVKARLKSYIVTQGISYIFYDYIFSSPGLINEFSDAGIREDVALMMLSNTLKELAADYNVFIQTATQLNDGWSKREVGARDQNCIRGSKAIADKVDIGLIGIKLPEEERKQVQTLWDELRKQHPGKYKHEPNVVLDIYKNRRGELSGCKVFRWFDYGTLHCEDLFITDAGYRTIEGGKCEYDTFTLKSFLDLKIEEAASQ